VTTVDASGNETPSDKAIARCDEDTVSFTYRDSRDHTRKTMTLGAHEFLRPRSARAPPAAPSAARAIA